MIIDAHNHPDWHGHNFERTVQNMAAHGIDRTWLLSWEVPIDEYDPTYNHTSLATAAGPIPFERCLRYKEQAPERFVLGYAPDPRRPDAIDRLQAAIDLYGVQVYGELKLRMMLDNLDALAMYRFCGKRGLPVTVHIDYAIDLGSRYPRPNWWYGGPIEALERALTLCPETTFIGHAPGFWAHISAGEEYATVSYPSGPIVPEGKLAAMFRQYGNLYADLSANSALNALSRDRDFGRAFLIDFQDRLLFGRDTFDDRMQRFLEGLDLPEAVLCKILAENALRLVSDRS
jgi:predicted TIM-barrel fold metal-dependent hydrolase